MTSKTHLLELMRKKEKILVHRRALALGALNNEHEKTQGLTEQLADMIDQNSPKSGVVLLPHMLGNAARLAAKLSEQRDISRNRTDYLQTEIGAAQKLLARHQTRESILKDRVLLEERAHQERVQTANDAMLPPQLGKIRR